MTSESRILQNDSTQGDKSKKKENTRSSDLSLADWFSKLRQNLRFDFPTALSKLLPLEGPVVQWIEQWFPVPPIGVRLPAGLPLRVRVSSFLKQALPDRKKSGKRGAESL